MPAAKKPVLVQMFPRNTREGMTELEVKKFFRKCKKREIIDEYLTKTSFALTKSQKRREKRRKNAFRKKKR